MLLKSTNIYGFSSDPSRQLNTMKQAGLHEPAKRIKVFRNGDDSFGGRHVIISQRTTKSWDSFMAEVTRQLGSSVAVRSIHTPVNGTEVRSIEELSDKLDYVAVGAGTFRKLNYSDLKERKPLKFNFTRQPKNPETVEVTKNRLIVPGRIKDARTGALSIFIHTNGDPMEQPIRVSIPAKNFDNWGSIIGDINERMKLKGKDAKSLYTFDGQQLTNCNQLEHGGHYVAVGCGVKGFVKAEYGTFVKPLFYVPLNRNITRHSTWQLQPVDKWRRKSKASSSVSSSVNSDPQLADKNSPHSDGATRSKMRQQNKKPLFGSDGNFFARQSKNTASKQVDYDNDEGGIYKVKKQRREVRNVEEVPDDSHVKVEVPVEERAAEDVMEEAEMYESRTEKVAIKHSGKSSKYEPSAKQKNSLKSKRDVGSHEQKVKKNEDVSDNEESNGKFHEAAEKDVDGVTSRMNVTHRKKSPDDDLK